MKYSSLLLMGVLLVSCNMKKEVDLIVLNAVVYTVNNDFDKQSAFAVRDGRFVELGSTDEILSKYKSGSVIDLEGKAVYPGFIDAHSHFMGYAVNLQNADLTGLDSENAVMEKLKEHRDAYPSEWLVGRGWDQNRWPEKKFPNKKQLDEIFPDIPVVLVRIDGHAVWVNSEAMRRLGVKPGDVRIVKEEAFEQNGEFTGVFIENAADLFRSAVPQPSIESMERLLETAQRNCFAVGLTMVTDAGIDKASILLLDSLQKQDRLKIRVDAWMNPDEVTMSYFKVPYRTERLNVSAVKLYADGALGSRGALLLEPYSDDSKIRGVTTNSESYIRSICEKALNSGLQVATHCIGDSANRLMLRIYGDFLKGANDLRWRIEHAQIVDQEDVSLFAKYCVIPSVQPTHATSDMHWATERIGDRIRNAYAYKFLMNQLGWIPSGTDFPIENISPIYTFYAAAVRKDLQGFPENGFQPENALTREEALKSVTRWAAQASFSEKEVGSIEAGKYADFVVLDRDIMLADEQEIPQTKVVHTYIQGEKVHEP